MATIMSLPQTDVVRLDQDRLTELYVKFGDQGAEDAICATMEELACRLSDMREVFELADSGLLCKVARNVSDRAAYIGLSSLSRVALDVEYCLTIGDGPAISATMARLIRVAARSLPSVWDNRDLSI